MIPCTTHEQPQANAAPPRAGSGQHGSPSSPSSGAARASAGEALVWHFVCDEICDVLCEVLCDDADDVDDAARGAGAPGVDLAVAAAPLQFPPPTAHERSSAEIQRRLVELTADEPAATAAVLGPLRKCWRAEEEAELRELVEEHRPTGSNEWRQVAELLGTGRSASAVENRRRKVKDRDARSSDPSPRDPDESERRITILRDVYDEFSGLSTSKLHQAMQARGIGCGAYDGPVDFRRKLRAYEAKRQRAETMSSPAT